MRLAATSMILGLTVAACPDGPTSVAKAAVRVTREDSAIRIENMTDAPRAYFVVDPEILASANWALCNTPDSSCLRLPAHGTKVVPFTDISGYGTSTKTIAVWTWRVVPSATPGQYERATDEAVELKL